ncbi:MAG: alpha/beta hydrolase [Clostridia bacterium]|nr:alpha/beta hydrolase [Clostridia bacterium]
MIDINKTLGEILSDPRIQKITPDAIKDWDLSQEPMWNKTLAQLREDHFGGNLQRGFDRLFAATETVAWYYPLYTEEECAEYEYRRGVNVVNFPSEDPKASERPWILLVPGGGFVNVWNLTEGWPVAAQFNALGYHVLILTYQVTAETSLLDRNMEDFAKAIGFARDHATELGLQWDRYIPCGFSAGAYLASLWNVIEKGYARFGLPKPQAVFPLYPVISWKLSLAEGDFEPQYAVRLFGCPIEEAVETPFEIPEHVEGFPPCTIFLAAGDEMAMSHSPKLTRALEAQGIPCLMEIGPEGGHGFADGTGMCMAGWTERAIRWYEKLSGAAPRPEGFFYGRYIADARDRKGRTPAQVYDLLTRAWCAETCAPRMRPDWSEQNRTLGQCSITAFLAQDLFGGKVYGVPLGDGNFHCFNVVDGCAFDLTSEQFGDEQLDYVHAEEQSREVHFAKEEKYHRYLLLKEKFEKAE